MDVRIRSFNAWRAARLGYKPSAAEKIIMIKSPLHSHTELQFSERYGSESFSATMADGDNCCRRKPIGYSHPEYWDTLIVPLTDAEEDEVYAESKKIEGQPYDVVGLMSFASDLDIIKPRDGYWWCTEAVLHCLFVIPWISEPRWMRPDRAFPTLLHTMYAMRFETERYPWNFMERR